MSKNPPGKADDSSVTAAEQRHKTPLRAEVITAIATVMAAAVVATGSVAVGWLQYRGPGSSPGVTPTATVTVTALPPPSETSPSDPAAPAGGMDLKDLASASEDGDWGTRTSSIGRHQYPNAITSVPDCDATRDYRLDRPYQHFRATVGLADDTRNPIDLKFSVSVNGKEVWNSDFVPLGKSVPVDVPLNGALQLQLVTDACSQILSNGTTTGVWADARLEP